ncbi:MAG: LPS export ABC transporter periplasmic protein LptC [Sulfurimonas sp.]|uniref:LPS export ABC transporter periplasmic protein LptC n=1 Tax=Sulfurimonas sp. TaxID=2022749 RepID=UPI0026101633|nr:LPS export ABC transporter periplasmic protein LptC [Sulfurimonas sp.]MDD5372235.1 LPS export ABC transporter periplasmic protein LptC [Sulfurimonas sp.]
MNINYFFLFILSCLLMIFLIFKPSEISQQKFGDVPLFSISFFTMHELNTKGLITLMNGDIATRYTDRYTVEKINYTDNSKEYLANMKSNSGIYKDDIVYLDGDIVYAREDGLTFETQKATYNKKTAFATADGDYVLYKGSNIVNGKELKYNNSLERVESKDVVVKYQLEERNK